MTEEVPPQKEEPESQVFPGFEVDLSPLEFDARLSMLKIDLDSVRVHTVDSVKFSTSEYPVRRHRWEKTESDF